MSVGQSVWDGMRGERRRQRYPATGLALECLAAEEGLQSMHQNSETTQVPIFPTLDVEGFW